MKSVAMEAKYQKIREIAERELSCSTHEIEHVMRVQNLCLYLAKFEQNIDLDVLKTAVLLHDIARVKEFEDKNGTIDHALLGAEMSAEILRKLGYSEEKIAQIKHCIATHRFRSEIKPQTKEAQILFDADKIDALGAVGIARAFMLGGQYGQKIYLDIPIETYLKNNVVDEKNHGKIKDITKHSANLEFELKFKHIPERLYTQKAREIAEERLRFMEKFYERLKMEIEAEL
jgi:uncharacterized protein